MDSLFEEACNPSRIERFPNEDLVRLENYIKEFSASYVYTHRSSSKEPLIEKIRKSMTRNVKSSAYKNLLGKSHCKFDRNNGKFISDDQQIFNFARDEVLKNISTKLPASLHESLCSSIKSIGQISCGRIEGTCWLVTDTMVITNHHLYMMIKAERDPQNPNLPITVRFDYFYRGQTEYVVTVEVDEERDPQLENPHLDYKILRLKENEGLRDRVGLGQIVRSRPLQEGLAIIVGHPGGMEMQEETFVVVSNLSRREGPQRRQSQRDCLVSPGVHMSNSNLLWSDNKFPRYLPYDTSLFSGASGSPIFDLNGNIFAMHTQGYTLDVEEGKVSLMEFGIQFNAIYEDMKQRTVVEKFFPNYNLGFDEQPMDEDLNEEENLQNGLVIQEQKPVAETIIPLEQLLTLGRSYQNKGQNEKAIKSYEQAIEKADETHRNDIKAQAYQHLGNVFTGTSEYKKAIEYYQKAREISPDLEGNKFEVVAYQWLGYNHLQAGQYLQSEIYYERSLELALQFGYKTEEVKANIGIGRALSNIDDFESSEKYFLKAFTVANQHNNKRLEREAHTNLGHVYYKSCKFDAAVNSYLKVQEISHDLGEREEEANACLMLGNTFKEFEQHEKAIEFYQKALNNSDDLEGKEVHASAVQGLGTLYFTLASVCSKDCDYQMAIEWYEKALDIGQLNDDFQEKALTGFGVACFKLGYTEKAIEFIQEAQTFAKMEADMDRHDAKITHEQKNSTEPIPLSRTVPGSSELWKWEESSKLHRGKLIKLREYGKTYPEEIKKVGGVLFCCLEEFLIDKGNDGTRVYVGLGEDGYEKAVKCLPRDTCAGLAEQEKKLLNEPNAKKSKHVVNYCFFDDQSDKRYFFLIMDLCEETLENFIRRSSLNDLVTIAPDIIQQILKGLADLHRGPTDLHRDPTDLHRDPTPILHRDLKPSNILRDVHGDWLLADFSISRLLGGGASTHRTKPSGTENWIAVESHPLNGVTDDDKVPCKKESDIQVAGMVAFYIATKGEHAFGEERYRLDNFLRGKPAGLDTLKDPILKDLLSWTLSHDPKDRPSAEEALKHPYLQPAKQQFEMLCKMGNQLEIKTQDTSSDVVRKLNNIPKVRTTRENWKVLQYLRTDFVDGTPRHYGDSWTECLRFIRNVNEHWYNRAPRTPPPVEESLVGNPQEYFLKLFPVLPAEVHRIVRSCTWKERPELKDYFT